jgi:phosphoribosylanthranilate isomerase
VTVVKICGICSAADAAAAIDAGADMLGFHFCPSPRRITPGEAAAIVDALPARPSLVGVFIDEAAQRVGEVARRCSLDLVQLHGSEPAGYSPGVPIMKVLKVRDRGIPDAGDWPDPLMLDSWSADQRGGTGRSWDWEQARALLAHRKVFVAGGLDADNVGELVLRYRPHGVDVSSGVEAAPRRKDPAKMRAFVAAVRRADEQR